MKFAAIFGRRALSPALLALWLFASGAPGNSHAADAPVVDANTASIDELQTIRGIGPATAQRIVQARRHEPFRDLDDLRNRVRGIGEKKLRKMRDDGLEVGAGGQVSERIGQGQVREAGGAARSASAAQRPVERYVGRPR